jgi:hypothetical protein
VVLGQFWQKVIDLELPRATWGTVGRFPGDGFKKIDLKGNVYNTFKVIYLKRAGSFYFEEKPVLHG